MRLRKDAWLTLPGFMPDGLTQQLYETAVNVCQAFGLSVAWIRCVGVQTDLVPALKFDGVDWWSDLEIACRCLPEGYKSGDGIAWVIFPSEDEAQERIGCQLREVLLVWMRV